MPPWLITVLTVSVVAFFVALAVRSLVKGKKSGASSCGKCSSCPYCGECGKR